MGVSARSLSRLTEAQRSDQWGKKGRTQELGVEDGQERFPLVGSRGLEERLTVAREEKFAQVPHCSNVGMVSSYMLRNSSPQVSRSIAIAIHVSVDKQGGEDEQR